MDAGRRFGAETGRREGRSGDARRDRARQEEAFGVTRQRVTRPTCRNAFLADGCSRGSVPADMRPRYRARPMEKQPPPERHARIGRNGRAIGLGVVSVRRGGCGSGHCPQANRQGQEHPDSPTRSKYYGCRGRILPGRLLGCPIAARTCRLQLRAVNKSATGSGLLASAKSFCECFS